MIGFKQFVMTAQKTKKCPEGYRFSKKLGVCVPIGQRTYYPFFGYRNGSNQNDKQNGNQNGNGSGNGNGNGNGSGNGNGGNGGNGNGNGS
jgi:hypothetical protein